MTLSQPKPVVRPLARWAFLKNVLWMIAYLLLTLMLIVGLEPGVTPPGFTGAGALAMVVILGGAFHLAGRWRTSWVFLVFGGVGAILLLPAYLGDGRLGLRFGYGYTTVATCLGGWIAFVLTMALLTRMVAKIRWRVVREVTTGCIICRQCGYDLRASQERCPECGRAFDANAPRTYRGTIRQWELRWLVRRLTTVLLGVGVPLAIIYAGLYWRSELPATTRVERLGGIVDSRSDLPREWFELVGPFENLFRHAEVIDLRRASITDGLLEQLTAFRQIEELHINGPAVTGKGLGPLAGLGKLERLYMANSAVNDAGLTLQRK
jgi:hypothetical protein